VKEPFDQFVQLLQSITYLIPNKTARINKTKFTLVCFYRISHRYKTAKIKIM